MQTRADGENRACVFDGFELFGIGYRTCADDGVGHFFGNQADGLESDGVRKVISRVGMPPSTRARDKSTAVLKSSIAITGTTALTVRISRGSVWTFRFSKWGCRFVEVKRDGG